VDFIPLHLGLGHISQKDFMKNHTQQKTAQILFADDKNDVAILVIDTYIH